MPITRMKFTFQFRYIKWPQPNEYATTAQEFYAMRRFPRVIGAVDGTHVALRNPSQQHNVYYNRKHFTSLNVMVSMATYLNSEVGEINLRQNHVF